MNNRRNLIVESIIQAGKIRNLYPLGSRTSFDVVSATISLGFPLVFKPLKNLLGATVVIDRRNKGIIVTTNRGLSVQRFTIAHELGHILLSHSSHFDFFNEEINDSLKMSTHDEEDAAQVFASEILAPSRAIHRLAFLHGWAKKDISDPKVIYQISLRLGVSFQACCWALVRSKDVKEEEARKIIEKTKVNDLKKEQLPCQLKIDPWSDVWTLSEADTGSFIEAGKEDMFIVRLSEKSSSGYLVDFQGIQEEFESYCEFSDMPEKYGGGRTRGVVLKPKYPGLHHINIQQKRPWNRRSLKAIEIKVSNYGKEVEGFPRSKKAMLLGEFVD